MKLFNKLIKLIHIWKLEIEQQRAVREIVLAVSCGDEIPLTAKRKLQVLDAKIFYLRKKKM